MLRGDRREHGLRPRRALGAEAAADVLGDHADALGVEVEHLGERLARAPRALDRVVEREAAVRPRCARVACGSIALLWIGAVAYVSSTTTSAWASACSASPWAVSVGNDGLTLSGL